MSFSIAYNTLAAARTHTATGDVRYYLNGVYFSATKNLIAATDGHRLFVTDAMTDADGDNSPDFILDNASVDAVLTAYKAYKRINMVIEFIFVDGKVSVKTPIGLLQFMPVDGMFPDISRVIPSVDALPAAQAVGHFNWQYLADADAALDIFTGTGASKKSKEKTGARPIFQRGTDSALMSAVNNDDQRALIVIMPVRFDAELVASWTNSTLSAITARFAKPE